MRKLLCSTAFAVCLGTSVFAQNVSDFENINIPTGSLVMSDSVTNGTYFTFDAGDVRFDAGKASWGGWELFNVSKDTSVTFTFPASMSSNITGGGYNNSTNFGLCFVNSDFMGNYDYIPVGAKLINNANRALGVQVTNSSYTYDYIANSTFYSNNSGYFHLIIKGYKNGLANPDSVVVKLADYTDSTPILLNTWEYADLTPLGLIDSLTFTLKTNDTGAWGSNTPSYFVIDNLTTLTTTSGCTDSLPLAVSAISHNSANISWTLDNTFVGADSIQLVINTSNTIAASDSIKSISNATSFNATDLDANTNYFAHVRAFCSAGNDFNEWTSIPFTTLNNTGIQNQNQLPVHVYPNPTTGIINLDYTTPLNVMVIDMNGKVLFNLKNVNQVNLGNLPAGTYMLDISNKENTNKIIKLIMKK
ncbi:MAG TPA: DUF4465 domain-containing protein [Edaphocola sp.]|nr:DUF4465 domain-containing protein [Edaphocola sp.]